MGNVYGQGRNPLRAAYPKVNVGPRTREQLTRLSRKWKQGEHVLIAGATGSGKTALARHVDQIRLDNGGNVIVFVNKLRPDETIMKEYKGWTRWETFKKNPGIHENRVLLWPRLDKVKGTQNKIHAQRAIFGDACDQLLDIGRWTVHIDEGLYFCDPEFLRLKSELAMLHAQGRSGKLTLITLTQRPSHLPLVLYGSASHAFIGRARERTDSQRLAELGGKTSAKELQGMIDTQGRHDFLWIPVAPDWTPERVNLKE